MGLPKICTNKFFLMALTASFAFTLTMFNVYSGQLYDVKADYSHGIDRIEQKVDENNKKIEIIAQDTAYIKGKLERFD